MVIAFELGALVRCVGVLFAVCLCGAVAAAGSPARAQTSATDLPLTDELSGGTQPAQFLLFAGFDIWHFSIAGYGGVQFATDGLDNDGFIARLFVAESRERYRTPSRTFTTDIARLSVLPGWRIKRGDVEIKLFGGLDLEHRGQTPAITGAPTRGAQFGLRTAAEIWWEPTPDIMLASSAYLSTIDTSHGGRAAAGWRLLDSFWIGPESSVSRDQFSTQYRFGAHLTGFKLAELEWSAAAGYLTDSLHRDGVYGRIGVLLRH
jgi:hypothetical protein